MVLIKIQERNCGSFVSTGENLGEVRQAGYNPYTAYQINSNNHYVCV